MQRDSSLRWTRSQVLLRALLVLPTLASGTAPLSAQGFDSPLVPAGRLRVQVLPSLRAFDTRFGLRSDMGRLVEEKEPLGFDFDREELGSETFPELQDDQDLLGAALGDPAYRLNLGSIRVFWDAYSTRLPVRVDMGITDWLTVGGTVPFERRRVDSEFTVSSTGANVGQSPLVTDPGAPTAFLNEFRAALQDVTVAVDGLCAGSGESSPSCQDARGFLTGANRTFEGLEGAYGGSEFFFLEGSPGAEALLRRVEEVQGGMTELGVSSFTSEPPVATEPLGADPEAFASRFITPIYGDTGLPLIGGQGLWELGDVELSAHFRLLNLASHEMVADARPAFHLQVAAGALLRLGTASRDTLRDFLDLDADRGTSDVELHLMGDLDWPAARLGARLQLVHGTQGRTEIRRRIAAPEDALVPGAPTGTVSWKPGSYKVLSLQPRVFLTPELALGGVYEYYDRGGASVSLVALDGDGELSLVDVSVLERETRATVHQVGVRLIYSTIEATRGKRTNLPFELEAAWEKAVAGSGGRAPQGSRFQAGARVYVRLWGSP